MEGETEVRLSRGRGRLGGGRGETEREGGGRLRGGRSLLEPHGICFLSPLKSVKLPSRVPEDRSQELWMETGWADAGSLKLRCQIPGQDGRVGGQSFPQAGVQGSHLLGMP